MDRLFDKHVCQCQREVTKRKYILPMVNTLLRRYACDSIGHVCEKYSLIAHCNYIYKTLETDAKFQVLQSIV